MSRSWLVKFLSFLALLAIILAACAPAAAPATTEEQPTSASVPTATKKPTSTPAPTRTPASTRTPILTATPTLAVGNPNLYENWGGWLDVTTDMGAQVIAVREGDEYLYVGVGARSYTYRLTLSKTESAEQYVLQGVDDLAVAGEWAKTQFPDAKYYWLELSLFSNGVPTGFIAGLPEDWEIAKAPSTSWSHVTAKAVTYDPSPVSALDILAAGETEVEAGEFDAIELYLVCKPFAKNESPANGAVPTGINPHSSYKLEFVIAPNYSLNLLEACPKGVYSSWGWRHTSLGGADDYDVKSEHAVKLADALLERMYSHFDGNGKETPNVRLFENNAGMQYFLYVIGERSSGMHHLAPKSWWSFSKG